MIDRPTPDQVDLVLVTISCESWITEGWGEERAYASLVDYFKPLTRVAGEEAASIGEEPVDSEYDDQQCYAGTASAEMSVEEWLKVADGYCMTIEDCEVLPDDEYLVPTMGVITLDGVIPAVAIQGTDQGWGYGGYEPALIASFYVSMAARQPEKAS